MGFEIYDRDNTIPTNNSHYPNTVQTVNEYEIYTHTFNFDYTGSSDYLEVSIIIGVNDTSTYFDVDWFKLELGDKATPFISKSISSELLDCQRYFLGGELIGQCYNVLTDSLRFMIPTPVKMRTTPKLVDTSVYSNTNTTGKIKVVSNDQNIQDGFSMLDNIYLKNNCITIGASKKAHGLTNFPYIQILGGNGFDAEIY